MDVQSLVGVPKRYSSRRPGRSMKGARDESGSELIRNYRQEDRGFLEGGLDEILAEKASSASSKEIRPARGWGRSYARSLLSYVRRTKGIALVAEVGAIRAGFAVGVLDRGIPTWMLRSGAFSRRGSVLEIHVDPRFRSSGLGGRLMSELERRLARRGCDWITAAYHEGHEFEARLYRSCGYAVNSVGVAKWLPKRGSVRAP